jgi:hypothetical protein
VPAVVRALVGALVGVQALVGDHLQLISVQVLQYVALAWQAYYLHLLLFWQFSFLLFSLRP